MFELRKIHPDVDLESSRSPAKSESWNVELYYPHDNIVDSNLSDECMKSNDLSACQAHVHFCDWSNKFVHWPENVRSTNPFQITSITKQSVSMCLTILQLIPVPPPCIDGRPRKELRLCTTAFCLFVCQLTIPFNAVFRMTFHVIGPRDSFCVSFSPPDNFCCSSRNSWFEHILLYSSMILSLDLHPCWVHPKYTCSGNDVGSPRSTNLMKFQHGSHNLLSTGHRNVIHVHRQE